MNRLVELFQSCWKRGEEETIGHVEAEMRNETCIVKIDHPRLLIEGKRYDTRMSEEVLLTYSFKYYAFMGIPYAAPPLEDLRFQPPQPFTWRELNCLKPKMIEAHSSDHPCLQYSSHPSMKGKLIGSEDCLYLNVYTRERPENISELLPVLVYIHGGSFEKGSSSSEEIKPYYILRNKVVFVTINYRLGVFGFLNMGIKECQGNAGLKDQVKALEWINLNIEKFGGDPNNVTISGHEAGATCVNLLMISPLTKNRNLFHKAIVQSGGIYSPWGFQKNPNHFEQLCEMKKYCTEPNVTREAVVKALMKPENTEDLMSDIQQMATAYSNRKSTKLVIFFGPSEEFRDEGAFIPPCDSIESLMEQAETIPVVAGITKQEGYEYFRRQLTWTQSDFQRMLTDDDSFIRFLRENLNWSQDSAISRMNELRVMYFGASEISETTDFQTLQDQLATFLTDIWFHRFFDNFKFGEKSCPLYVYQLDFYDWWSADDYPAPRHGDDINYLYNPSNLTPSDWPSCKLARLHLTDRICCMWGSLCEIGNPRLGNFQWKPHTEDNPHYVSIDVKPSLVPERLGGDRWTELKNILESEPIVSLSEPSPT